MLGREIAKQWPDRRHLSVQNLRTSADLGSGAAATIEIKLHEQEDPGNDSLLDCQELASEQQKANVRRELAELERKGGS